MEENVEYIEREDEFDIQPIEEIHKRRLDLEDDDVDVLTLDGVNKDFSSSAFYMPVILGIGESDSEEDVIAIGTGQFRRKSPSQGRDWEEGIPSVTKSNEFSRPGKEAQTSHRRSSKQTKRKRAI